MKSVLNYFVRKAFGFTATAKPTDKTLFGHLLRIKRNIHEVYEWLYGRLSAEHLPKRMPMKTAGFPPPNAGTPSAIAQDSDNLLAHLHLLDGRKISNGYADGRPADDGIPDGVSLARLLCDSTLQPTELIDDNVGWELTTRIGDASTGFPFLPKKVVLNCKSVKYAPILVKGYNGSNTTLEELHFPMLEECGALFANNGISGSWEPATLNLHTITMPKVKKLIFYADSGGYYYQSLGLFSGGCPALLELELPNLEEMNIAMCGGNSLPNIQAIRLPKLKRATVPFYSTYNAATNALTNLLLLEIGEMETSLNLSKWTATNVLSNPLFLSNFREYIASRLADRTGGSTFTLTLSAEVYAAVTADQDIYDLITSKNWNIAQA